MSIPIPAYTDSVHDLQKGDPHEFMKRNRAQIDACWKAVDEAIDKKRKEMRDHMIAAKLLEIADSH